MQSVWDSWILTLRGLTLTARMVQTLVSLLSLVVRVSLVVVRMSLLSLVVRMSLYQRRLYQRRQCHMKCLLASAYILDEWTRLIGIHSGVRGSLQGRRWTANAP